MMQGRVPCTNLIRGAERRSERRGERMREDGAGEAKESERWETGGEARA